LEEKEIEAQLQALEPPPKFPDPLATVVIVDGLPIAETAKVERLKAVLKKLFTTIGPLGPEDIQLPLDKNGSTAG
jgi:hypothetical protein